VILGRTNFRGPAAGWDWPPADAAGFEVTHAGCVLAPLPGKAATIAGPGVHTRNGDGIELLFETPRPLRGKLSLSFAGGMEHLGVDLDFARRRLALRTSEWNRRQPVAAAPLKLQPNRTHRLRIDKTEGAGRLVKLADARVRLDGRVVLEVNALNVLPEMGVAVSATGAPVLLKRFCHHGKPSGTPQVLRIAGWQMPNRPDIDANLDSLKRGLLAAAEKGAALLVTPETSLTGLFNNRGTLRPSPAAAAERKLRRFIRQLKGACYLIAGLPVWQPAPAARRKPIRYNACRLYDPDGHVILTAAKIHSCEQRFWHGYRLAEFSIDGAPCCLHICHDGRYPQVWTLPIMFGARLVLHPCNGGAVTGTVDAFEARSAGATTTMHTFYVRVNGGGGSAIVSPAKHHNLLARSHESRRDNPDFPNVASAGECLFTADLRLADAFGYWPVRSFRASEQVAQAYLDLYRALGGGNVPRA